MTSSTARVSRMWSSARRDVPGVHLRTQFADNFLPSRLPHRRVANAAAQPSPVIQVVEAVLPVHLLATKRGLSGTRWPGDHMQGPRHFRASSVLVPSASGASVGPLRTFSVPSGKTSTTLPSSRPMTEVRPSASLLLPGSTPLVRTSSIVRLHAKPDAAGLVILRCEVKGRLPLSAAVPTGTPRGQGRMPSRNRSMAGACSPKAPM